jgi:hypothetical protein
MEEPQSSDRLVFLLDNVRHWLVSGILLYTAPLLNGFVGDLMLKSTVP